MKTGIPKKIETDENHAALVSYGVAPSVELPLTPMSETAGRMAVQEGAKHLGSLHGVRGILFSCVPGVSPAIHVNPAFSVDGIVHNGVAHMPGGGPLTATLALTNATLRYVLQLANRGYRQALKESLALLKGLNISGGKVLHRKVSAAFGLEYRAAEFMIS